MNCDLAITAISLTSHLSHASVYTIIFNFVSLPQSLLRYSTGITTSMGHTPGKIFQSECSSSGTADTQAHSSVVFVFVSPPGLQSHEKSSFKTL